MAQLKLRSIRELEVGRWCKRRQMWVDVYLLRAARILLIIGISRSHDRRELFGWSKLQVCRTVKFLL
jgi:hypothetical protein